MVLEYGHVAPNARLHGSHGVMLSQPVGTEEGLSY